MLCKHCTAIDFDSLLTGIAKPWGLRSINLRISAETCNLCALFIKARTEIIEDGAEDRPLYIAGLCSRESGTCPLLIGIDLIEGVDSSQILESNHQIFPTSERTGDRKDGIMYRDLRLRRLFSRLEVIFDGNESLLGDTVPGRRISPAEDTTQIGKWVQMCDSSHEFCARRRKMANMELPTRLVDVGENGRTPKLVESGSTAIRGYLALSHRWGGAHIITTTKATLEKHKTGVPFDQLCATFRDATWMTRKLGYSYIWIDSLCIIQDSASDWQNEAARMATIYQNAALTLAAACATSGDTGLFLKRDAWPEVRLPYDSKKNVSYVVTHRKVASLGSELVHGPLNTRGWCLQERFLSPRTVHFGITQLIWECQTMAVPEKSTALESVSDRFGLRHGFFLHIFQNWEKRDAEKPRRQRESRHHIWYTLVSNYSRRDLTVPEDKLPALSGLASAFASSPGYEQGDEYLAGLWKHDLPIGLLWCAGTENGLRQSTIFRAPTWSWAAYDGVINVHGVQDGQVEVEEIVATVTTESDPYGKVTSGLLMLRGFPASLRTGKKLARGKCTWGWSDANMELLDCHSKRLVGSGCLDDCDRIGEGVTVECLMVLRVIEWFLPLARECIENRGQWAWCLLLKCLNGQTFKRIGLGQVEQSVFKAGKTKFKII